MVERSGGRLAAGETIAGPAPADTGLSELESVYPELLNVRFVAATAVPTVMR